MSIEAGVEQLNLTYNEQEDRMLFKLGLSDKTEIIVWVTRRICKSMWALLQSTNISHLPEVNKIANKSEAVEGFVREAAEQKAIKNMDFRSEYVANRQPRTEEPMFAVQCVLISSENHPPQLELQCKNGQSVKIALNNELVLAISNMVQISVREAGWDVLLPSDSTPISLSPTQQMLH